MTKRTADAGAAVRVVAGAPVPERLPASLALPATALEVAQFVAVRAAACVGADYSNLALLDAAGTSLRLFHGTILDPAAADRFTDVAINSPYPISAATRSGQAVLLPNLDAYRERFPEIVDDIIAAGIQSTASLPLHRADGTPLGAIGFAWAEPPPFDRKLESALRAVAHLCTETIERAERYDDEHELIVELQRSLLADVPHLAGVETAARYLPAGRSSSVGGDWYEGLRLSEERLAVVVGDVTGHGMAAAADMALIRGMITALLHAGVGVGDVFSEVSGVINQRSRLLLATAALVVVDVITETISFATAGHPPPLLLHPDGRIQMLDTANGPMLGMGRAPSVADTAPFRPGSQLVMFTDGLVERRDRPFALGIQQAAAHLASLPGRLNPTELIDTLLDALTGDQPMDDDIAVVVVTRRS